MSNRKLDNGKAHTIVKYVEDELNKLGIALDKCTSLATDGASVMMGRKAGVGVQIKSKHAPFCIQTHCFAHKLNLACSDAIKNEDLKKFRDKFAQLYQFMSASSERTTTLKKNQDLLEELN